MATKHPTSTVITDLPGRTYRLPFECETDWRPDIVVKHADHRLEFIELTFFELYVHNQIA